jgi:hypothetical protein
LNNNLYTNGSDLVFSLDEIKYCIKIREDIGTYEYVDRYYIKFKDNEKIKINAETFIQLNEFIKNNTKTKEPKKAKAKEQKENE